MAQYLIAHKCRGEPAFEVAETQKCPLCEDGVRENEFHCDECNGEGFWYITHYGHRAYPYWIEELSIILRLLAGESLRIPVIVPDMPIDLPEHFQASAAPKGKGSGTRGRDLLELIGLSKPLEPMTRRNW